MWRLLPQERIQAHRGAERRAREETGFVHLCESKEQVSAEDENAGEFRYDTTQKYGEPVELREHIEQSSQQLPAPVFKHAKN